VKEDWYSDEGFSRVEIQYSYRVFGFVQTCQHPSFELQMPHQTFRPWQKKQDRPGVSTGLVQTSPNTASVRILFPVACTGRDHAFKIATNLVQRPSFSFMDRFDADCNRPALHAKLSNRSLIAHHDF
jgi:hypothetical protein